MTEKNEKKWLKVKKGGFLVEGQNPQLKLKKVREPIPTTAEIFYIQ